jgi:hypothetical protein
MEGDNLKWLCKKCNRWLDNCIDMDYHYDTIHPDFTNKYVLYWYMNGKKGMSAYD